MSDTPIVDCGRCGQPAPVDAGRIACPCTPGRSAVEVVAARAEQDRLRLARRPA
ncbi:MAG: hypothetical protein ACRDQA_30665 [Nocardioidaceae bacterium]